MHVPPFSLEKQLIDIGKDIEEAVLRVINSGSYIGGSEVTAFEEAFAESISTSYAVSCNSGTDALILALRALNIGPDDEVITPSFSFFATAEAISIVGARPVFVDVDPNNYLLDENCLNEALSPSTKAVLPVHLFGCPVNMTAIVSFAKKNGLKIIEDCAQAAGSQWNGMPVGSIGDIGCFSFFPTKNLGAAGDGGAVTTNNSELAQKIRELAVHGMPKRYFHTELGYNSRLDAIQAAILNVKLPKLTVWIKHRQEIASRYQTLLKDIPGLELPSALNEVNHIHSWNQFVIKVKSSSLDQVRTDENREKNFHDLLDSSARDLLKENLSKEGVNTIIYYPIPIHLQPAYKNSKYRKCNLVNTEMLCSEVLSLPIFPELNIEQQKYVTNNISNLLVKK